MTSVPWLHILLGAYVVWVLGACTSMLLSRRSPASTLAWMFAFVSLPFLSGLYYLVFGPRRLTRRRRRYGFLRGALAGEAAEYLRSSCCETRPRLPPHIQALALVGENLGQGAPRFASAVKLLDNGDVCMEALEAALRASKHHVHLEYYIWEPDKVGTHFRDLLVEALGRGVEVRILIDALGSPHATKEFWAPLRAAGGQVLAFNPVRLSIKSLNLANFRTHRKIVICDGTVGFLGGINLHDPESKTRSGQDAWRDEHVRIEGEPARKLQRLFLENWAFSGGSFSLTPETVRLYFPPAVEGRGVPTQILASGPDDERAAIHAFFLAALATARTRVWIETPYLVPDEPLEAALRIADLRGVDVQIIVPKKGDSKLVTGASHTYCESLVKAGIEIHEYGPPMLHAKTMIVDDSVAVVGTANLDNRSFRLNFEVAAVFYSPPVVKQLAVLFEQDRAVCRPFPARRRSERLTNFFEALARLTSPIL